ncbi:PP2C family protein-serine/threonine phosphatase [Rhodopila globiformis]|nr:PP2C family protein-serine/threonine phosphatase [Rhodopila globiformis]
MVQERAVAWLRIGADLTLLDAGGELDHYGLTAICRGEPVGEQALFLEGLLPLFESPYVVPSIGLTGDIAADVHIHEDADGTWVLLLDVTAERDATRRVQQKAYDMTLLQEKEALLNRRLEAVNAALRETQRELEASRDLARQELERKQLELAEARTLQLALAPPPYRGRIGARAVAVDVVLEPAKEVGGDLVDHFRIGNDMLVFLLGDVSDKGAGAALMMARTHALFRGLINRPDAPWLFRAPENAVGLVNRTLAEGNAGCMFVTLLIATFDAATNRLTYTRAGHVPPFLRRCGGAVERLGAAGGLPLGLSEDAVYASAAVTLAPGDEVLTVTDGITEAMDQSQCLFGEERVAGVMRRGCVAGTSLLQQLLAGVRAFEAGGMQSDDIAAVLVTIGTS